MNEEGGALSNCSRCSFVNRKARSRRTRDRICPSTKLGEALSNT